LNFNPSFTKLETRVIHSIDDCNPSFRSEICKNGLIVQNNAKLLFEIAFQYLPFVSGVARVSQAKIG